MWELFIRFFRVGLFGFGGGPAMITLIKTETLEASWLTEEQFLEALAVCSALPGPIAVKLAAYIGWDEGGFVGAVVALSAVNLPALTLLMGLGSLMMRYRELPLVAAALKGVKPAVIGMLFFVAWDLAPEGIVGLRGALLAVAAFGALALRVHPAFVMMAALGAGVLFFRSGA